MKTLILISLCLNLAASNFQNQRIIGGQEAWSGQFPYSAAIYKSTSVGRYFCGGALITRQFILTAGQCVDGATLFTIYLGTNNIKTLSETSIEVATDEYILHPGFNSTTLENDIGLIKLRIPIELSNYIGTIDFPYSDISTIDVFQAIGWGQTSDETSGLSDQLHWVTVGSITNNECKVTYGNQITDNMACIVGAYNEGACTGDSGSPIIQHFKGVIPVHMGVASFVSPRGCESSDPSGYTRTFPYLTWIRSVIY